MSARATDFQQAGVPREALDFLNDEPVFGCLTQFTFKRVAIATPESFGATIQEPPVHVVTRARFTVQRIINAFVVQRETATALAAVIDRPSEAGIVFHGPNVSNVR